MRTKKIGINSTKSSNLLALVFTNILEWFDFFLFAVFSKQLAAYFFPGLRDGLAVTFSIFFIGFLSRVAGGKYISYLSNKRGRNRALVVSICLIGFPGLVIAISPSGNSIGILSGIILLLARLIQGVSVGGEYSLMLSLLIESNQKCKGYAASLINMSSLIGLLLAHIFYIIFHNLTNGWKIGYLTSFVISLMFVKMRLVLVKSFKNKVQYCNNTVLFNSNLFKVIAITAFGGVSYYTINLFSNSILSGILVGHHIYILLFQTLFMIFMVPFIGYISDYYLGSKKILLSSLIFFIVISILLISINFTTANKLLCGILFIGILACISGYIACFPKVIFTQCSSNVQLSFSYNIGVILFGGTAPLINHYLLSSYNHFFIFYYLLSISFVALIIIGILIASENQRICYAFK